MTILNKYNESENKLTKTYITGPAIMVYINSHVTRISVMSLYQNHNSKTDKCNHG